MDSSLEKVRGDFAAREERLKVFEIFSGTATPGEGGAPDVPGPGEPDPGLTVSDALAIGTLSSLGLTGLSYGMKRYSAGFLAKDPANPLTAMKLVYDRMQVAKALEAVQEGKSSTKLMEFLPYVGVPVKRMNITKLWSEVEDSLKQMKIYTDNFAAGYQAWESNWEKINKASSVAFVGFGAVSALGAIATTATAALHDRATPLLDDFAKSAASLEGSAALRADAAVAEFGARASFAMETLDAKIDEIALLAKNLPDFDGMVDILAEAEVLLDPIKALTSRIKTLIGPYEGFLDVADVIAAPISGVLDLFENPPKVLPTIVGYKTITPGFWLTVPDPTWSNPLQTKRIWVDPVKAPIPGFKELFDPIPRNEVQKIIDLITKIAGLPQELLEKALSPILQPIQNQIDKLLQPILDKLNPFTEYLGDFSRVPDAIKALRDKLGVVIADIEASAAAISRIAPSLDPIEEIGPIDPAGMPTYFGDDADEFVRGAARGGATGLATAKQGGSGGFDGAVLSTGGGDDTLLGTALTDFLLGGAGDDEFRPDAGDDVIAGGDGVDIVVFFDALADHEVVKAGDAIEVLGPDGAKLLIDVEILRFRDGDVLAALAGNDTLTGGPGPSALDGGAGFDTVSYAGEARGVGVRLDGGANWGAAAGDVLTSIEGLVGTRFADTLIGSNAANRLEGGAGDDRIFGLGGMDTIDGGAGADTLDGGAGFDMVSYASAAAGVGARLDGGANFGAAAGDVLVGFEALEGSRFADALVGSNANNIIRGGAGADRLFGSFGSDLLAPGDRDGADTVDGGAGFDWLDFTGAGAGVGARLDGGANFGATAGDRYVAMEAIEGSAFGDVLIGSNGTNVLKGNGGDDRLFGLGGRDGLYGGDGDDTLDGGAGGDLLDGGDGFDAISYAAEAGFVGARLDGGANWGAATGDVIRNAEALIGTRFNDRLIGNAGANALEGGAGADLLWGFAGADRFVFAGPGFGSDIVKDFQNGVDLLDFSRHAGVTGIGDLAIFDVGAFVRIDAGADRVFLEGAVFVDIEGSDFLFS